MEMRLANRPIPKSRFFDAAASADTRIAAILGWLGTAADSNSVSRNIILANRLNTLFPT